MKTKVLVAQSIFSHDALYRRSSLLDQFRLGLREVGALQLVELFPDVMSKLFVYTGDLSADELEAVYADEATMTADDKFVFSLFLDYIRVLTASGMVPKIIPTNNLNLEP